MHLGDMAKGFPPRTDESILPGVSVELGTGAVALPAILKAATAAGVRSYFVDQEDAPGDGLDSLRKSFEYLRSV
jgi:sugar phosphate isomerase/epimerase